MKKNKLISLGLMASVLSCSAAPFELRFKTTDLGDNKNILAAFITSSSGAYVDTFGVYGSNKKYIGELKNWQTKSRITSYSQAPADAVMGATRSSFSLPSPVVFTWDLKDSSGNTVPDGTYTIHLANAHKGSDSYGTFSFVKDGNAGTRTVANFANFTSISVVYTPPNTAPVAQAQNRLSGDGLPLAITLSATDAEGDPVTYNLLSQPASGHLFGSPPDLTYAPVKGMNESVSFTFNASDGKLTGNTAAVSIQLVFTDSNGNGIPDSWQSEYGVTNSAADSDQDGASNYEEYMAGTNPTNSASVFAVTEPLFSPDHSRIMLQWSSTEYSYYNVQSSTNLLSGWDTISSNLLATPPMNSYIGTVQPAVPAYYRIRREP